MHEYHSSPAREYKIEVKDRDMNQILVIGSLNMDVVVRMERLPALGETVLGEEYYHAQRRPHPRPHNGGTAYL